MKVVGKVLAVCSAMTISAQAMAKTCEVSLKGTDAMQYDLKEIKVAADCTEVKLTLEHTGKLPKAAMGHNFVLVDTKDKAEVLKAATAAGVAKDYIPADKRVIAHTKLLGGGEKDTITFATSALKKGGDYTYFCSFPGHEGLMKGKFIF